MEAIGYLFMALFGVYFFFVGRQAYRQEIMFRGKAKGPLGLVGQLGLFNANRLRAALAFFALVALSLNLLFFYAFELPVQGALIAEAAGIGVGLGFYLTVVRPVQKAQERHFEAIRSAFEEIMTAPKGSEARDLGDGNDSGAAQPSDSDEERPKVELPDPQICIFPPRPDLAPEQGSDGPVKDEKDGESADGDDAQRA